MVTRWCLRTTHWPPYRVSSRVGTQLNIDTSIFSMAHECAGSSVYISFFFQAFRHGAPCVNLREIVCLIFCGITCVRVIGAFRVFDQSYRF